MTPDPKPPPRIRDLERLKDLHIRWRGDCVLANDDDDDCYRSRYSLHHIHRHPRDDVEPNLVMLCGHGTVGHHGLIEAHDRLTCQALGIYLIRYRLDTMEYLGLKLGGVVAVREWLRSQLYAPI